MWPGREDLMIGQKVDMGSDAGVQPAKDTTFGDGRVAARALVVEDEAIIALFVEDILARLGFQDVHLAHDLATGWTLAAELSPTFAVLDVNLGRELVFPLASELRRRRIPFVFSTGNARSTMPREWQDDVIVPKPLDQTGLARALRTLGILPAESMSFPVQAQQM